MSLSLSNARLRVRLRLEDTGASTSWSDEEIDAGLTQALDEYSHRFPAERSTVVSVQQDDTSIDLPEGAWQVKRIVDPRGQVIPPQSVRVRGRPGEEQAWEVWGDRIEFNRALFAGEYEIRFTASREFPENESDPLPVPDADVSLLVAGAVAWCLEQRSVAEWKRGVLPARYETVLRRARDEYHQAWQGRMRQVRTGTVFGTG
jgi:hypothetical protein